MAIREDFVYRPGRTAVPEFTKATFQLLPENIMGEGVRPISKNSPNVPDAGPTQDFFDQNNFATAPNKITIIPPNPLFPGGLTLPNPFAQETYQGTPAGSVALNKAVGKLNMINSIALPAIIIFGVVMAYRSFK